MRVAVKRLEAGSFRRYRGTEAKMLYERLTEGAKDNCLDSEAAVNKFLYM